ncbi:MAG TPA: hypothetical protein EYG68_05375 [Leucothrix mucor]|nr:hypothetical protein [Leucothrix mucor]
MNKARGKIQESLGYFGMERRWFRYSSFVPRLYNWCKTLGFEAGNIMPSRAFCSDESQGYPIMLMAKHFGAFPFNHGRVGGIMAVDRHGSHAHHGEDLLIVHASHVGYEPNSQSFGVYRRAQTEHGQCSSNCGKIDGALGGYLQDYQYACDNIFVEMRADHCRITIDNHYLLMSSSSNLILSLDKILELRPNGNITPLATQSTSRTFRASAKFFKQMQWFFSEDDGVSPIDVALLPDFFTYQTDHLLADVDGSQQLEVNLIGSMPWIVASSAPLLIAAQVNIQAEFDRAYRSILQEPAYEGRNLLYITGLHVDISPAEGQVFPLTKFIPWAAYVQLKTGESYVLEQDDLYEQLNQCGVENPDQISMDEAIQAMENAKEVVLHLP